MSYIGPVLNAAGTIETSPDCLILDRRRTPFKSLRCEFKYIPASKQDFAHNGKFDVAIVWALPSNLRKEQLRDDLFQQNGCDEVIVMSEFKPLRELPDYNQMDFSSFGSIEDIKKVVLDRDFPAVFALFIAAKICPKKFQMEKMVALLTSRFPDVKRMTPTGRANAVSAFLQTKPALLKRMHGSYYRWNSEIDNAAAVGLLAEIIAANFVESLPSADDIASVSE